MPRTIVAAIGAAVLFIVPAVIYLIIAAALGFVDTKHPFAHPDQILIAQLMTYFPVGLYLVSILPSLAQTSRKELGFRKPSLREVGLGISGALAMLIAVTVTGTGAEALTHRHDTQDAVAFFRQLTTPGQRIVFIIVAVLLAPMIEELLFRVFLFNALSRYAPLWTAAVASGVCFGLVHIIGNGDQIVTVGMPLAVGGIVLAYVYATTRNYWTNVLAHASFNAINVVAVVVFNVK